jgi:hypothetical protein
MIQTLSSPAVESTESQPVPEEVDFRVAPADDTAAVRYEIVLDGRILNTVADYRKKRDAIGRANSDLKDIRATMTYELALLKAVHVGRGRDGDWGDYLKNKFGLARRTVDRWIKKEVSQGQLPPWVADKLRANMDPDPAPVPKDPIYELTLVFPTKEERDQFAAHAERLTADRLRKILFETITFHEETQVDYVPCTKAFSDEDDFPTFLDRMEAEQPIAEGVAA